MYGLKSNLPYYDRFIKSEEILPYQHEIWCWLLGFRVDIGERFCNPFRNDRNPGCWLNEYNGMLFLADFGDSYYNGWTIFKAAEHKIGEKNFTRICQYLYYNYILPNKPTLPLQTKTYSQQFSKNNLKIEWSARSWNKADKDFWDTISIKQLEQENLSPVNTYWFTNNGQYMKIEPKDITYAYFINEGKKVYRPFNIENKWLSNMQPFHIGGNSPINEDDKLIIVTKSLKDYCIIKNAGYNCRYIINESAYLTSSFLQWLDFNFEKVIFFMDNDEAGVKAIKKFVEQWNTIIKNNKAFGITIPDNLAYQNITDPFDYTKAFGFEKFKYFLTEQIELIYDTSVKKMVS